MAKNMNGNTRWLTALVGLLVIFAGVVGGFVRQREGINQNHAQIADHEERMRTVEESMAEQRVNTQYIKSGIEEIKKHMVRKDDRR